MLLFDEQLLAFVAVAAALTVTPGADTLLVLKNAAREGGRAGWTTALGICSGLFVHAVFSALGLSVILARSATAFHALKLAGAAYLIWLGIASWRSARRDAEATGLVAGAGQGRARSWGALFREGFLCNLLNPKVAVFYLAFLPQFIAPTEPALAKALLLAALHNGMGLIWLGAIAAAIARGRHWVDRPRVRAALSRVSGALLIALGVRLGIASR